MDANKSTSKQSVKLTATMTPEMCRAIKRQETNSGLDYWRSGFNSLKVSSDNAGLQARKPNYRRVTQVNFDFPGVFLPNVDTQSFKQKRKDSKGHSIVLNRTKTLFNPEIKTGHVSGARQKSESHNPSKKATVTDLTCLQLADTLLSYKSPFSGIYGTTSVVYNTPHLRSRYVELFSDDKNEEDSGEHQNMSSEEIVNNETGDEKGISTFSYQTYKPEQDKDGTGDGQISTGSPTSSDLPIVDIDTSIKTQIKPQKSILKNGLNRVNRPSSETAISHAYTTLEKPSLCSYQLPRMKTHLRSVSETRLPTCPIYPKIQNDLRDLGQYYGYRRLPVKNEFSGTIRNIPVKLEKEYTHTGGFRDLETRKRSVRFNASHEVREYTPCEPTSFC